MKATTFYELNVYNESFALQQKIFEVSKSFPREETYSLTDQIRRASRSIGANIAEAWRKRRYKAHFVSKLTDADAENAEVQHWLKTAQACGYISESVSAEFFLTSESIGRKLGKMISSPESWTLN